VRRARWPLAGAVAAAGTAAALALGACSEDGLGAASAAAELALRVESDAREVAFGEPFALRVVRTWPRELEPAPFADDSLLPLQVERLRSERRDAGPVRTETLHYRARAFVLPRAVVAPIELRAAPRAGGAPQQCTSAPFELAVHSSLGAGDGPLPEGPGELLPLPRQPGWWPVVAGAAVLLGAAFAFARGRRRAPAAASATTAPPLPRGPTEHDLARERLRRLAAAPAPQDRAGEVAFCDEVTALLRPCIGAVLRRDATVRTSEELLAELAAELAPCRDGALQRRIAFTLAACDRVKFAAGRAPARRRARLLASATAFVDATAKATEASA